MGKKEAGQKKVEKRPAGERRVDENEINREIDNQLKNRVNANMNQAQNPPNEGKAPNSSSKKVVKKRVVKMMKDNQLVALKEEILDEDGNILKTYVRKDNLEQYQ